MAMVIEEGDAMAAFAANFDLKNSSMLMLFKVFVGECIMVLVLVFITVYK